MIKYNGKWIDCFKVSIYEDDDRPGAKNKILFETPHCDYLLTKEQWNELLTKLNEGV